MTTSPTTSTVDMTATYHLSLAATMAKAVASTVRGIYLPTMTGETLPIAVAAIEATPAMIVTTTVEAASEMGVMATVLLYT